jgi:hypothetical protein
VAEDIATELQAIKTIQETLEPLKPEVRARVMDYVFKVLGIEPLQAPLAWPSATPPALPGATTPPPGGPGQPAQDILSLKEEKKPTTATQMIAVVAYYLAHGSSPRQDYITADDVEKYFIQGRFPMPGSKSQALVNTKNAGYLDAIDTGRYKLNSVGYNLVAHKMPRNGSTSAPSGGKTRRSVKKTAKKEKR